MTVCITSKHPRFGQSPETEREGNYSESGMKAVSAASSRLFFVCRLRWPGGQSVRECEKRGKEPLRMQI